MARDLAGNTLKQAKGIKLGSKNIAYRETVGGGDLNDFYRFAFKGRSGFKLALSGLKANADVELVQDRNRNGRVDLGEVVASSRTSASKSDSINIAGLGAGTYYVRVFAARGSQTRYSLTLSTKSSSSSFAYRVVEATNAYRQQNGLHPLTVNTQLSTAAQIHSQNMALQDFFDHAGLDGSSPFDRIQAAGYRYSSAAENIAAGYTTSAEVVQGWIGSPGHRVNLLNSDLREIGVGYYHLASDTGVENWGHYWTQVFAIPS